MGQKLTATVDFEVNVDTSFDDIGDAMKRVEDYLANRFGGNTSIELVSFEPSRPADLTDIDFIDDEDLADDDDDDDSDDEDEDEDEWPG